MVLVYIVLDAERTRVGRCDIVLDAEWTRKKRRVRQMLVLLLFWEGFWKALGILGGGLVPLLAVRGRFKYHYFPRPFNESINYYSDKRTIKDILLPQ